MSLIRPAVTGFLLLGALAASGSLWAGAPRGFALSCEALFESGEVVAHPSLRFEALSPERAEDAIKFVQRAFAYEAGTDDFFEIHPHLMEVANEVGTHDGLPAYWLAIQKETNRLVGTIGLYHSVAYEEDGIWVDWYTVDKRSRGMGIGKTLLQLAIAHGREIGLREIKLYTSNREAEAAAQIVYEKMGFKEYRRIPQLDEETGEQVLDLDGVTPVEIIFRKIVL